MSKSSLTNVYKFAPTSDSWFGMQLFSNTVNITIENDVAQRFARSDVRAFSYAVWVIVGKSNCVTIDKIGLP